MITVGADPEVFVRYKNGFVSGHYFDCGSKEQPRQTKNGTVQVDGMALEVNVNPSKTEEEFLKNLRGVLGDLKALVHPYTLEAIPTVHFGKDYISTLPEEVQRLGCNIDYNAYTERENQKPNENLPFRTGAGHIHIGFCNLSDVSEYHFDICCSLVRELDYLLGLPSLVWDKDNERRMMYGKAGSFRPKKYGLEYRVLSNAWLNEDDLCKLIFRQAVKAFVQWDTPFSFYERYGTLAQEFINLGDSEWRSKVPNLAKEIYGG